MADPAHRHGGPDAGWYVPGPDGWQRISDAEVRDHGDAAHFMSNPNGRHAVTVASMTPRTITNAKLISLTLDPAARPGPGCTSPHLVSGARGLTVTMGLTGEPVPDTGRPMAPVSFGFKHHGQKP